MALLFLAQLWQVRFHHCFGISCFYQLNLKLPRFDILPSLSSESLPLPPTSGAAVRALGFLSLILSILTGTTSRSLLRFLSGIVIRILGLPLALVGLFALSRRTGSSGGGGVLVDQRVEAAILDRDAERSDRILYCNASRCSQYRS